MNIENLSIRFDGIVNTISTNLEMTDQERKNLTVGILDRINAIAHNTVSQNSHESSNLTSDLASGTEKLTQAIGDEMVEILIELKDIFLSSQSPDTKALISQIDQLLVDLKVESI